MTKIKVHWSPDMVKKLVFILIVSAVAVATTTGAFLPTESLQANVTFSEVQSQTVQCYHTVSGSSGMTQCGEKGCLFPDGSYCAADGCYNADGSQSTAGFPQMDPVCRNADGTERTFTNESQQNTGSSPTTTWPSDGQQPPQGQWQDGNQNWENTSQPPYDDGQQNFDNMHPSADQMQNQMPKEQMEKEVSRLEREVTRMERQILRMKEKGMSLGDADALILKVKAKISEARTLMGSTEDQEEFFWALEDAGDIMNFELREQMENQEQSSNVMKYFHDMERMIKDMEREAGRIKKSGGTVPTVYGTITALFKKAQEASKNSQWEDVQATLEEMSDLSQDFWDQMEDFHQESFGEDVLERGENMLEHVEEGLSQAKEMIQSLASQGKDVSRLRELLEKASILLKELRAAVGEGDMEHTQEILEKLEFGIKEEFEREMGRIAGRQSKDAWEDVYTSEDMVEQFDFEDSTTEAVMERIAEKMSQKIIAKLIAKGLPAAYLENLAKSGFDEYVQKTLETVSYLDEGAAEILTNKTAVLEKISAIDQQIAELQKARKIAAGSLAQLMSVKEKIASYNFVGEAGIDIQEKIQSFIEQAESAGSNEANIVQGIAKLQAEAEAAFRSARSEKFEKGIIPFADTDDNEWYTIFAADAKKRGLIEGTGTSGGTELNPGGNTNLAEAITLFGRLVGVDETLASRSGVGSRLPSWARAAAGTLEAKGVNLDEIFSGKNPEDAVSRAEIARLLQQILGLPEGASANFSDLHGISDAEQDAINAVNSAGIMTGEGGTSNFNPDGSLNRAALVKVMIEGLEEVE